MSSRGPRSRAWAGAAGRARVSSRSMRLLGVRRARPAGRAGAADQAVATVGRSTRRRRRLGLGQGLAGGSDRRLDVVGRDAVVGDGPDLTVRILHHQHVPRPERVEEGGAVAVDLEQDEVRRDAAGIEAAGRGLGRAARRSRCRPCPRGPRPVAGRWRGRRQAGRSCRPDHRPARRAPPRRGCRPGASRRRRACARGAPAR